MASTAGSSGACGVSCCPCPAWPLGSFHVTRPSCMTPICPAGGAGRSWALLGAAYLQLFSCRTWNHVLLVDTSFAFASIMLLLSLFLHPLPAVPQSSPSVHLAPPQMGGSLHMRQRYLSSLVYLLTYCTLSLSAFSDGLGQGSCSLSSTLRKSTCEQALPDKREGKENWIAWVPGTSAALPPRMGREFFSARSSVCGFGSPGTRKKKIKQ